MYKLSWGDDPITPFYTQTGKAVGQVESTKKRIFALYLNQKSTSL